MSPGRSVTPGAGGTLTALDLLRTLAIAGVVLIHTSAAWMTQAGLDIPNLYTYLNRSVSFAVPAFLFLSGFLLFHRRGLADDRHSAFLAGRLKTVLVPYLLWSLVYHFGFPHLGARAAGPGVGGLVRNLLLGESAYHLYFVVLIFQFYLLYPVFRAWLGRVRRPWLVAALVLAFNLAEVWFYFGDWATAGGADGLLAGLREGLAPYRGRLFLTWVFYFVLGALGGRHAERLAGLARARPAVRLAFPLALIAAGWALLAIHGQQLRAGVPLGISLSYIQPTTMVLTAALAGATFAFPWSSLARGWRLVSRHAYQVYLVHPILLDLYLGRFADRSVGGLAAATAAVFVASLAVAASLSWLGKVIDGNQAAAGAR